MPGNVRGALAKRNLLDAFRARPDYQQNEYLKWIATASGPTMKQQRLDQMLDEVEKGALFKGEAWTPPAKT
jgi:Bacteriocin-protection, YdeI or OmpD-Associated